MAINVLISGGRKLVREGLSALLEKHQAIRVVGQADDVRALVKLIEPLDAHIALLLPQSNGNTIDLRTFRELIRSVTASHPQVKIILVTHGISPPELKRLMNAGAAGCVTMECASSELLSAVETVIAGEIYVDPSLAAQVTQHVSQKTSRSARSLAPREVDVLRQYAEGRSTKEIARSLRIGSKTVETHRRRLMQKLSRHSIAELTQYAIAEGIVSLPSRAE
jgi:DNA-binding NarL/FixJ family response regulator